MIDTEIAIPEATPLLVSLSEEDNDRALPAIGTPLRFIIPAKDLLRLQRPHGLLSDDCINTGAQVLLQHFGTGSLREGEPVIFSTRIMSMHRVDADDRTIWRDCYKSQFWTKNVWIIPIHHQLPSLHWTRQWTVAVVYIKEQRIAYFDSFANKKVWESDAAVSF